MAVDPRQENAMKVFETTKSAYDLLINFGERTFVVWLTATITAMLFMGAPGSENFRAWIWLGCCMISTAFVLGNFWLKRSQEETKRETIRHSSTPPTA